ncbi:hypothetical protein [Haloplanus pelagicus]|jgi:hypothetical protein|uniref:hypothetical protein n=1 Tax=Haloplanus pelagicus TaxID=2949995 RepID=UPI00203E92CE|nr:hypothetical protein [Haloplanus sp. HW8-1]
MQQVPVDDVAAHGPDAGWRYASTDGSDRFPSEWFGASPDPSIIVARERSRPFVQGPLTVHTAADPMRSSGVFPPAVRGAHRPGSAVHGTVAGLNVVAPGRPSDIRMDGER